MKPWIGTTLFLTLVLHLGARTTGLPPDCIRPAVHDAKKTSQTADTQKKPPKAADYWMPKGGPFRPGVHRLESIARARR